MFKFLRLYIIFEFSFCCVHILCAVGQHLIYRETKTYLIDEIPSALTRILTKSGRAPQGIVYVCVGNVEA